MREYEQNLVSRLSRLAPRKSLRSRVALAVAVLGFSVSPLITFAQDEPAKGARKEEAADKADAANEEEKIHWLTNIEEAKKQALAENKQLLLFFTGSDWCGFCIRLEEAVLSTPEFREKLEQNYVPVVLDFPNKKELPEDVKEQNKEMKELLKVSGFPTVFIVSPELLPHGRMVGFGGAKSFWESFNDALDRSTKLKSIPESNHVAKITTLEALDPVLATIPSEMIRYGWLEHLERVVSGDSSSNADLKSKWNNTLVSVKQEIEDEEHVAQATKELQAMSRSQASAAEILEFLNKGVEEAQGRPTRLRFYLPNRARFLQDQKEFDKALEDVNTILAASWTTERDRVLARNVQSRIYLNQGKIDEGVAIITEALQKRDFPSEEAKNGMISMMVAYELSQAKQHTASLNYWRAALSNEALPPTQKPVMYSISEMSSQSAGADPAARGEVLLAWGKLAGERGQAAMKNEKAALAAVCFRAAGLSDRAAEAIALVDVEPEEEEEKEAETQSPRKGPVDQILAAAKGTDADALKFLSANAQGVGRGIYLMDAAFALKKAEKTKEAEELVEQAKTILESARENATDQGAVEALESRMKTWGSLTGEAKSEAAN